MSTARPLRTCPAREAGEGGRQGSGQGCFVVGGQWGSCKDKEERKRNKEAKSLCLHPDRWFMSAFVETWTLLATQQAFVKCNCLEVKTTTIRQLLPQIWASLVAETVKNPPAMWETWVQSLDGEDPLEEGKASHSSILAWRIPMDRGAWQAIVHGVATCWK